MTSIDTEFARLHKHLLLDLSSLSSESKRRNSDVKQASDKSVEILKTVKDIDDLSRHPDFVVPFILACSSSDAKLTTIGLQCLQKLSTTTCIPYQKLSDLMDSLTIATTLAADIQLKVLQLVPTFFKTYSKQIEGKLCESLVLCCSNMLLLSNKSPMIADAANATLQQLVDGIFERLNGDIGSDMDCPYEVRVDENEIVKTNTYHNDANALFTALCSALNFSSKKTAVQDNEHKDPMLFQDLTKIPVDYALEIMESVLRNSTKLFCNDNYKDLLYLLKIKAVPSLLRLISSSNQFSTVLRSFRAIEPLLVVNFVNLLELELEVILSLLIHVVSFESVHPIWKKVLSLELIHNSFKNFAFVHQIYLTYDKFKEKKHILKNILTELNKLLSSEDVTVYLGESTTVEILELPLISIESSTVKTSYLQLLDKSHPGSINITYIVWLIISIINAYSDGLSKQAFNNLSKSDTKNITDFYTNNFDQVYSIQKRLLYSNSLDNTIFHSLVRSFQKLAHTAGVLSLVQPLNKCIKEFSIAIVKNVPENDGETLDSDVTALQQTKTTTVLNAISETLMGQDATTNINSTDTANNEIQEIDATNLKQSLPSRTFNRKHISLFRALISLSVSLGPTFDHESWSFVLVCWQWVSYYVYGPSSDFVEKNPTTIIPHAPRLSKNDSSSLENSLENFYSSSKVYPKTSLKTFLSTLIDCSEAALVFSSSGNGDLNQTISGDTIQYCCYNKMFFVSQINEVMNKNYSRFVSEDDQSKNWNLVMHYFIKLFADREILDSNMRLFITRIFTNIVLQTTNAVDELQDTENKDKNYTLLEKLVSSALDDAVKSLLCSELSFKEVYDGIADTEAKILLLLLSNLKDVLNDIGDHLTISWPTVFIILNSPFIWLKQNEIMLNKESEYDHSLIAGLNAKQKDMVEVSYDVFKLISDDFLQTLPLNAIKNFVDTLVDFVLQTKNLNISLSSISHFWLVGDYLRVHHSSDTVKQSIKKLDATKIKDETLADMITSDTTTPAEVWCVLWLYLLKKLIECTADSRAAVKNGAIQTFYRLVASNLNYIPDWELIFEEVLKPLLTRSYSEEELALSAEFLDCLLQGLVNLFPVHFGDFSKTEKTWYQWKILLKFFEQLLKTNSTEVSFVVIFNYQKLLKEMLNLTEISEEVLRMTYEIWCGYNIIYGNTSTNSNFQQKSGYDCVDELMKCYPHLYSLMEAHNFVEPDFIEKSLSLMNSAVRYPLLPGHTKDNKKPSTLQQSILNNLELIKTDQNHDYAKLVLLQLSVLTTLPFETKEKIEKKLASKLAGTAKVKIPTFEGLSYKACLLLKEKLEVCYTNPKDMLFEKYIIKVMRNLSESVERKSLIDVSMEQNMPLWLLSSICLRKIFNTLSQIAEKTLEATEIFNSLCDIFTKITVAPLFKISPEVDEQTENIDVEEYKKNRDVLLSPKVIRWLNKDQLTFYVSTVWTNSFLYQLDEIEEILLKDGNDLHEVSKQLSEFRFSDIGGSTVEPPSLSKYHCSVLCLEDLSSFIIYDSDDFKNLRIVSAPYLVSRSAFALRRYISDQSLVGRAPIAKIRKIELGIILNGLSKVLASFSESSHELNASIAEDMKLLYPLILRAIPLSHKVPELQKLVLELSLGFTKLSLT